MQVQVGSLVCGVESDTQEGLAASMGGNCIGPKRNTQLLFWNSQVLSLLPTPHPCPPLTTSHPLCPNVSLSFCPVCISGGAGRG